MARRSLEGRFSHSCEKSGQANGQKATLGGRILRIVSIPVPYRLHPPSISPPCLGSLKSEVQSLKSEVPEMLTILYLHRLSPLFGGFFRHNTFTLRDLHRTNTNGPCMILVWSSYHPPIILLWSFDMAPWIGEWPNMLPGKLGSGDSGVLRCCRLGITRELVASRGGSRGNRRARQRARSTGRARWSASCKAAAPA